MADRTTNGEFGQLIGVSPSMASRIRNGDRLPSVGVLDRISESLDLPLETLILAHRRGAPDFGRLIRAALNTNTWNLRTKGHGPSSAKRKSRRG